MKRACLLLAGCLSTPPPAQPDAAPASDPCARDPRPATACNGSFSAQPFAPPASFVFRQLVSDDVNADGTPDLLVVDDDASHPGIWILLGPVDAAAPMFHAHVLTTIRVGAIQVRQVVGDDCPDLTAYGSDGANGFVQVWPYDGSASMFASTPLVREVDTLDPDLATPTVVKWARVRAIGDDLLVGDGYHLRVLRVGGDTSELAAATIDTVYQASQMEGWDAINGISVVPRASCTTDAVIVENAMDGRVLVDAVADAPITWRYSDVFGEGRASLDGTAPDDIIGTGARGVAAYLVSQPDADTVTFTPAEMPLGYTPLPSSYYLDGFAVGDLGGSSAPEVVAIDHPDGTADASSWILWDTLHTTVDQDAGVPALAAGGPRIGSFPDGFVPTGVTIAGSQVWVVSSTGALACYVRSALTLGLVACGT